MDSDIKLKACAKFPTHKIKNIENRNAFLRFNLSDIILNNTMLVKNQLQKLIKMPHLITTELEYPNKKGKPFIADINNGLVLSNFDSK